MKVLFLLAMCTAVLGAPVSQNCETLYTLLNQASYSQNVIAVACSVVVAEGKAYGCTWTDAQKCHDSGAGVSLNTLNFIHAGGRAGMSVDDRCKTFTPMGKDVCERIRSAFVDAAKGTSIPDDKADCEWDGDECREESSSFSKGAIAGIVIGCVLLIVIVAVVLMCVLKKKEPEVQEKTVSPSEPAADQEMETQV